MILVKLGESLGTEEVRLLERRGDSRSPGDRAGWTPGVERVRRVKIIIMIAFHRGSQETSVRHVRGGRGGEMSKLRRRSERSGGRLGGEGGEHRRRGD